MEHKVLISFEDVTLGYEGQPVIEGLNFTIEKGEYLCVLGQNGSGKSTMMKALLGFLSPMTGKIQRAPYLKKNAIGYLPQQQPSQADFPASVKEVVLSGCQAKKRFCPFYTKSDKELAARNMELMNITHLKDRSFRELSGGQKQRALLARALCAAEDLILLDEPTAGLDPVVTQELYALIERLNKEYGMTVIMISHDLTNTMQSATHILHLGRRMLYHGTVDAYDREKILSEERKAGA
ncbi:MAG: metal ABC transporter ATP-binding protein [Clostridia bacterium]|nr:metal ABC transporter ATP-binding protein [Clostridia bacterium]MBQ8398350.1 metal ABC transporter ATP-binding protein [Clostridia bacterium]